MFSWHLTKPVSTASLGKNCINTFVLRYHFCRPNKQSWGKEQGCFKHRVQCGKREVKDTGKSSSAGKQSTCNSRKSLRAYKVISNSHEAAQLTAPLVLPDKKVVLAAWVGVDTLEGKGEGCVQQLCCLRFLGQSLAKH